MGLGYRWWRESGMTREFRVKHGMQKRTEYLESPMRPAVEHGITVRHRLEAGSPALEQYRLLRAFHEAGATDYLAVPLRAFIGRQDVVTWATDHRGGFTEAHVAAIEAILPAIAVVLKAKALKRTSAILLEHLSRPHHRPPHPRWRDLPRPGAAPARGPDGGRFARLHQPLRPDAGRGADPAARRLFRRRRRRGAWPGRRDPQFVGDGVLAIFEPDGRSEHEAVKAALAAGQELLRRIDTTNDNRAAVGQELIAIGVGLHLGEVIYGNVGAVDRLDYTAIGPAVNLVCRLEGLTKDGAGAAAAALRRLRRGLWRQAAVAGLPGRWPS